MKHIPSVINIPDSKYIHFKTNYGWFACHFSPFGNCQNYSILWITILYDLWTVDTEEGNEIFAYFYYICRKPQLIIDIQSKDFEQIELFLKPYFLKIVSTPYISTNDTNMIFCRIVLDIKKLNNLIINKYNFINLKVNA